MNGESSWKEKYEDAVVQLKGLKAEVKRLRNVIQEANDRYHRDPKSTQYDYPPFALTAWDDRVRWSTYIQKIIDEVEK